MARRLPPLNAVRAFEAAARHVSLSKAALELHVTHGAISRQVRLLEARLGVRLLERRGRGLELTPEGRQYLAATREALDRLDSATADLTRRRGRDVLSVNVAPTFAINWLIPRLPAFRARCPGIEVRLVTDIETSEYSPSDCDLGVHSYLLADDQDLRRNRRTWKHLRFEQTFEEVMFPLVSPLLLRSGPRLRTPADLRGYTLLHSRSVEEFLARMAACRRRLRPRRGCQPAFRSRALRHPGGDTRVGCRPGHAALRGGLSEVRRPGRAVSGHRLPPQSLLPGLRRRAGPGPASRPLPPVVPRHDPRRGRRLAGADTRGGA